MNLILFALGLLVLILGADTLVNGATSLAKRLRVPDMVIGLTLVSIGTSLPELIVNINSSISGNTGITIGNIVGSNICNILLILGITSAFYPLPIKKNTAFIEIPFGFFISLILLILLNLGNYFNSFFGLSRLDGIIFLILMVAFLFYVAKVDSNELSPEASSEPDSHLKTIVFRLVRFTNTQSQYDRLMYIFRQYSWLKSLSLSGLGILLLYFGGELCVGGAVNFAKDLGLSQELIGFTIVAIGTSTPELLTSLAAARRGNVDIAVGNIVGSNVFNIIGILGISAVIHPIEMQGLSHINTDVIILISVNVLFFIFAALSSRYILSKIEGIFFLIGYIAYTIFLINRG